jgi:hypothetical protein
MKAFVGSRGIAPLVLNIVARRRLVVKFTHRQVLAWKKKPVPIEMDARWAPRTGPEALENMKIYWSLLPAFENHIYLLLLWVKWTILLESGIELEAT